MAYQQIFKRYELKYLLTREQKQILLDAMHSYMIPDNYGRTTIRNIYYDTDNYRLIRHSIEKPLYKEKLRLRSYRQCGGDKDIFVELKKKYNGVVYKRRIPLAHKDAVSWLNGEFNYTNPNQIQGEIQYFRDFYQTLHPTVFLSYDREAFFAKDNRDLRITFDENILSRQSDLSFSAPVGGTSLLDAGYVLMEIKTGGGIPLWLTDTLTRQHIYKTSFSKYGTAYIHTIFPNYQGGTLYA